MVRYLVLGVVLILVACGLGLTCRTNPRNASDFQVGSNLSSYHLVPGSLGVYFSPDAETLPSFQDYLLQQKLAARSFTGLLRHEVDGNPKTEPYTLEVEKGVVKGVIWLDEPNDKHEGYALDKGSDLGKADKNVLRPWHVLTRDGKDVVDLSSPAAQREFTGQVLLTDQSFLVDYYVKLTVRGGIITKVSESSR